jgi:hypothetical protein
MLVGYKLFYQKNNESKECSYVHNLGDEMNNKSIVESVKIILQT